MRRKLLIQTIGRGVLLAIIFAGCQTLCAQVSKYGNFPYEQPFMADTIPREIAVPNDGFNNNAQFPGNGLQLTENKGKQFGGVFINDRQFTIKNGIHIEFEYSAEGGTGDGISVFMFDAKETNLRIGAHGAGIGYAYNMVGKGGKSDLKMQGLSGAYLGIAFDSKGNFKQRRFQDDSRVNGIPFPYPDQAGVKSIDIDPKYNTRDQVTIRGAQGTGYISKIGSVNYPKEYSGYPVLISQATTGVQAKITLNETFSLNDLGEGNTYTVKESALDGTPFTIAGGYRKAIIHIFPLEGQNGFYITVKIQHDNTVTTVIDRYVYKAGIEYPENAIPYTSDAAPAIEIKRLSSTIPDVLRLGFAASTGDETNRHIIKNLFVTLPWAAEAYDDTTSVYKGQSTEIYPLENDIAYSGQPKEVMTTGNPENINPNTFWFLDEEGNQVEGDTYSTKDGEWKYSIVNEKLSLAFTPSATLEEGDSATVQYSIKGYAKDPSKEPYDDRAYRSLPATITVRVKDKPENYWIGGNGSGTDATSPYLPEMFLWSKPENWTAKTLPGEGDTVKYAVKALDLYVDSAYKAVAVDATGSQQNQGLRILKNASLELTATASATPPLNLGNGELYIDAGGPDGKNGTFITQPGASVEATVQMYSRAENRDTTNNLYDPDALAWQYFGVPVEQATAVDVFKGAIVRRYDEKAENNTYWLPLTGTDKMTPFLGYELAWLTSDPKKGYYVFNGLLVNKDKSLSLGRTPDAPFAGYHVVGNPYTAGLKIKDGLTFGPEMEKTVYLFHTGSSKQWDHWASGLTGDGSGAGQYIAVPQALAGTGTFLPETVSSMQGFVVKLMDEESNSTLKFNYAGVKQNTGQLRSAQEPWVYTMVTLKSGEQVEDWTWLFSETGSTSGFDNGYDGRKLVSNPSLPQLYAVEEDGKYQVITVPDVDNTYLAFKAQKGVQDYTLTFNHQDIRQFYNKIYLVDLLKDEGTLIDMTADGSVYSFTASNADQATERFKIVTKATPTGVEDTDEGRFDARNLNNEIVISNGDREVAAVVYTITGQMVYQTRLQPYQTKHMGQRLAPGVYIVRGQLPGRLVVRKVVVK